MNSSGITRTRGRGWKSSTRSTTRHQTLAFVLEKKREYLALERKTVMVWEAMEFLNTLVDDSDPDTELSQIEHLMQTSEAIRAATSRAGSS